MAAFAVLGAGAGFMMAGSMAGASLAVPTDRQGAVAGLIAATQGLALIAAPAASTALYALDRMLPFAVLAALLCALAVLFALPTLATARELSEIEPWHAPAHGFSFPDDVQPVLDRNCIACHDGSAREDGATMIDLRGDEYITDWSSQISGNCGP